MYLIVGLGNPGQKFDATRHNIGFHAIDAIGNANNIQINKKKFQGILGQGTIRGEKAILLKPMTYMNESGKSIREVVDFYKIPVENILVIFDDVSLPPGQFRIRRKGSAGGHNGIKSIIAHLGTQVFGRIKFGVGEKPPGWDLADYVLGRFSNDELKNDIGPALQDVNDIVTSIMTGGYDVAMNQYNKKKV